jgi:hypothetical protein
MRVSDALRILRDDDGDDYPATDLIPDPGYDPVTDMHPGDVDPDDIIAPDDEDDRGDDDDCDPDNPDDDDEECRCDSDPIGEYHRQFVVGGV